jgi:hypothetical protein
VAQAAAVAAQAQAHAWDGKEGKNLTGQLPGAMGFPCMPVCWPCFFLRYRKIGRRQWRPHRLAAASIGVDREDRSKTAPAAHAFELFADHRLHPAKKVEYTLAVRWDRISLALLKNSMAFQDSATNCDSNSPRKLPLRPQAKNRDRNSNSGESALGVALRDEWCSRGNGDDDARQIDGSQISIHVGSHVAAKPLLDNNPVQAYWTVTVFFFYWQHRTFAMYSTRFNTHSSPTPVNHMDKTTSASI